MTVGITRLTFGDDRDGPSDRAWSWITAQQWPACRIDVLRSVAPGDDPATVPPGRSAPARCGFTSVRTIDTPLAPAAALAAHRGTELLLVGAQAWSGGQPAGVGRTVETLARRSAVPVAVVRAGGPVHSVLACVDGSPSARTVADVLLRLPLVETAHVTVLTVAGSDGEPAAAPQEATAALARAGVRAHLRVSRPDDVIATSGAAFRILDVARRLRPDLVVVGAPRTSLADRLRAMRGSVALEVTREAACSVLLAR